MFKTMFLVFKTKAMFLFFALSLGKIAALPDNVYKPISMF
jgi:hypothetical protein